MKCNKCGYDWSNSGDSAHVCGPVKVKQQEQGEPVAKDWRKEPWGFGERRLHTVEEAAHVIKEKNT